MPSSHIDSKATREYSLPVSFSRRPLKNNRSKKSSNNDMHATTWDPVRNNEHATLDINPRFKTAATHLKRNQSKENQQC